MALEYLIITKSSRQSTLLEGQSEENFFFSGKEVYAHANIMALSNNICPSATGIKPLLINYYKLLVKFVLLAEAVLHRYVYVCGSSMGLTIAYLNSLCPEAFWCSFFFSVYHLFFLLLESREVIIFCDILFVNFKSAAKHFRVS